MCIIIFSHTDKHWFKTILCKICVAFNISNNAHVENALWQNSMQKKQTSQQVIIRS